jgi:hypothetical protein
MMPLFGQANNEFEVLDLKIVKAYNAEPKQARQVFMYCMEILDLDRDKNSPKSGAWADKARRIIPAACYYEIQKELKNKNYKAVYIWSSRGITYGVNKGEIGGFQLDQLYNYLVSMKNRSKHEMDRSGESYSNLSLEMDVRKLKSEKAFRRFKYEKMLDKAEREDKQQDSVKESSSDVPDYVLAEGPAQDKNGKLYVRVKRKSGKIYKIQYYEGKGWGMSAFSDHPDFKYYKSWRNCADQYSDTLPFGNKK